MSCVCNFFCVLTLSEALYRIIEEVAPIGAPEWELVAGYFKTWADSKNRPPRTVRSLKDKYKQKLEQISKGIVTGKGGLGELQQAVKVRGCSVLVAHVCTTQRCEAKIREKSGLVTQAMANRMVPIPQQASSSPEPIIAEHAMDVPNSQVCLCLSGV